MTTEQKIGTDIEPQSLVSSKDVPPLIVPNNSVAVLSPATAQSFEQHHSEFANFEEGYVRSYIALADTKAAWAFTIASGLLAYLFSQQSTQAVLLHPKWSFANLLLLSSAAFLTVSAFYSFRVVAPRLKSPSREGIVFFGSVSTFPSATAYVSAVGAKQERDLVEARLKHCYDVSKVCSSKYADLKKAIWIGLPGFAFGIIHLLLG